jgi:hypothetical protein
MAFEGLIIELVKSDKQPAHFDFSRCCEIMKLLSLDSSPVFDPKLYEKFVNWAKR